VKEFTNIQPHFIQIAYDKFKWHNYGEYIYANGTFTKTLFNFNLALRKCIATTKLHPLIKLKNLENVRLANVLSNLKLNFEVFLPKNKAWGSLDISLGFKFNRDICPSVCHLQQVSEF